MPTLNDSVNSATESSIVGNVRTISPQNSPTTPQPDAPPQPDVPVKSVPHVAECGKTFQQITLNPVAEIVTTTTPPSVAGATVTDTSGNSSTIWTESCGA